MKARTSTDLLARWKAKKGVRRYIGPKRAGTDLRISADPGPRAVPQEPGIAQSRTFPDIRMGPPISRADVRNVLRDLYRPRGRDPADAALQSRCRAALGAARWRPTVRRGRFGRGGHRFPA